MVMLIVVLSALVVSMPHVVSATPSLGLDGVGKPGGCCVSELLTTNNANDVIVVVVECGYISCSDNVSSVTDSSGLDYTLRASFAPNDRLWEYYAIAPAPLSSDNITVLASGPRFYGFMAFAIEGVNTATVFDASPSLPAVAACAGPGPNDCTVSAETSAVDFVIASTAINDAGACTASTGFTEVTPAGGSLDIDYQIVDTLGAKTYFTCSGTDPTAIVLDALTSSNPHAPIFIDGNSGFTAENGVTGGTGTSDDPYMISGWTIQAQDYGIEIADTTVYFTITNVTISWGGDGIVLSSIQNGVVQNSHISVQGIGIGVENSVNFQLTSNDVRSGGLDECGGAPVCERWGAIFLNMSSSFDVSNNSLEGGPGAINGFNLSDASIVGNTGGGEDGITLHHLSGFLVSQNSIRAHTPIAVSSCGDLTIENNALDSPNAGIMISNCNNVLVWNNTANVSGGEEGIWVTGSDSISITANTLSHNTNGIRLSNFATGNTITGNLISNNQCGIQTDSSSTVDQNYVADNTFAGNTQDYCSL